MDKKTKEAGRPNQWHGPFCSAIRLEMRGYTNELDYYREYTLSTKPLMIDLLVVKKAPDVVVQNPIGRIFRGHNIMEYKSPHDALNIDVYYKAIAYTCLYKAAGIHVDSISADDLTVSLVRDIRPVKLMKQLSDSGLEVVRAHDGVYYVHGSLFPVQVIVTSELPKDTYTWLSSLTDRLKENDARRLVMDISKLSRKQDREDADAVLQLVMNVNEHLFQQMKGDDKMCDALRKLMAPEITAELTAARNEGRTEGWNQGRTEERHTLLNELLKEGVISEEIARKYANRCGAV